MNRVKSAEITIHAPAEKIFDYLARPANHVAADGSGTVRAALVGPERLYPGAKFRMKMHMFVPYTITNTVVTFVENTEIAWRHSGRHIWRYRLQDLGDSNTKVTESFEWGQAPLRLIYELMGVPSRNLTAMVNTLNNLKQHFEASLQE
ncbi:SRPBCC family protein [Ferrimicrobium sp.]|uniref:SRPBCC family protein n=1 Tax=Ferrimicrobium sp. TaxID=2926050 RepID=UPI002616426F|nr:SRPBCC family protein [Ferrimicrobium sp.]